MAPNPVEQFAAEAEDARTRIASTIDEIQDRIDPRRIVGDAVDRVSGGGAHLFGQARDSVRDTVRAHPLALGAALAAVGVALLARKKLANATVNLGDELGDYTDYDDGFGFAEVRPSRFDAEDEAEAGPGAAVRAQALASRTGVTVGENPVVAIVVGLAAGALLGALFPTTETERRVLGETGGKLGAAARAAARRAGDELDAAGLSVDGVRARAGQASRAVRSVVDAARDELKA